jgi:hypothetical protein
MSYICKTKCRDMITIKSELPMPNEYKTLLFNVINEKIELGSDSIIKYRKLAQSALDYLRSNKLESLEIDTTEGTYEAWNVFLCVLYDEI